MEAILTAEQMRQADSKTIERLKGTGLLLMEHASAACVRALDKQLASDFTGKHIVVLAGCGNNGGDGMAVARQLVSRGVSVAVYLFGNPEKMSVDAAFQFDLLRGYSIPVTCVGSELDSAGRQGIMSADVVVDALLGTGFSGVPRGVIARMIEQLEEYDGLVLAVDVPSGLHSDSGVVPEPSVRADITVTFGRKKICHVLSPACDVCGEVILDRITIPDEIIREVKPKLFVTERDDVRRMLPPRPGDAHKGSFGHVCVVAGQPGRLGASAMAGLAALKCGSGLVTVHETPAAYPIISQAAPELMHGLYEAPFSEGSIQSGLTGKNAVLLGQGFGTEGEVRNAVERILEVYDGPVVLDADVFRIFNSEQLAGMLRGRSAVLTPHPGEMASLHGVSAAEVQRDRLAFVRLTAETTGAIVVLKGQRTVVAAPDGRTWVNPTGNSGLATAGSGDVLGGMILSFAGQGMEMPDAALAAVYLHGLAGDIAAERLGQRSVTATSVINNIADALRTI